MKLGTLLISLGVTLAIIQPGCSAEPEEVTIELLQRKVDQGALVVDVRTPEEFENFHFKGALNINVQELENRLDEFGPKDQPIIVYCRTGNRSGVAKGLLEKAGYQQVINGGGLAEMSKVKPK